MTLSNWIFEDIICWCSSLYEIVTDNGSAFITALKSLMKLYPIRHIIISRYNFHVDGLIKRAHFYVLQLLFKSINGDWSKWSIGAHSVFWAEWITVCKWMGCSPYFTVTGSHPLIPLNISKVGTTMDGPRSIQVNICGWCSKVHGYGWHPWIIHGYTYEYYYFLCFQML